MVGGAKIYAFEALAQSRLQPLRRIPLIQHVENIEVRLWGGPSLRIAERLHDEQLFRCLEERLALGEQVE